MRGDGERQQRGRTARWVPERRQTGSVGPAVPPSLVTCSSRVVSAPRVAVELGRDDTRVCKTSGVQHVRPWFDY